MTESATQSFDLHDLKPCQCSITTIDRKTQDSVYFDKRNYPLLNPGIDRTSGNSVAPRNPDLICVNRIEKLGFRQRPFAVPSRALFAGIFRLYRLFLPHDAALCPKPPRNGKKNLRFFWGYSLPSNSTCFEE